MKNLIITAFLAVASMFASVANSALVYSPEYFPTTGPGGLSIPYPEGDAQVYAGLLDFTFGSNSFLVMSNDYNARVAVGEFHTYTFYTYEQVMAGAPVRFTKAQYSLMSSVIDSNFSAGLFQNNLYTLQQVSVLFGNETLALTNTAVWGATNPVFNATLTYPFFGGSETEDWSQVMMVLTSTNGDEFLVPLRGQNISIAPSIPEPSAYLLFASGLGMIVFVVRRKKGRK